MHNKVLRPNDGGIDCYTFDVTEKRITLIALLLIGPQQRSAVSWWPMTSQGHVMRASLPPPGSREQATRCRYTVSRRPVRDPLGRIIGHLENERQCAVSRWAQWSGLRAVETESHSSRESVRLLISTVTAKNRSYK